MKFPVTDYYLLLNLLYILALLIFNIEIAEICREQMRRCCHDTVPDSFDTTIEWADVE